MPIFAKDMPLPQVTHDTREFWEACRDHRLIVQRCTDCQSFRFAPAPVCYRCHSFSYENVVSKGVGEVFTWTITHRPVHPAVRGALPFNVIVVRLDDCGGAFITSNLIEASNEEICAGMRVEVCWDPIDEEITLPRFRIVKDGAASVMVHLQDRCSYKPPPSNCPIG